MSDLKNPQIIYLKGWLFLGIVIISTILILVECPSWKVGGLLVLIMWASARLYYFMFYVIEKYVDDSYKFSGIWSFLKYVFSKAKRTNNNST
jgi:hypothetical protein